MEEILRKLQKDASGHKHKAIRDACVHACEMLESQKGSAKISPSQLRERCLLPLQMALESKNTKLGQTALSGMQKLLCEDRFVGGVGMEVEVLEKQLLSQMLEAIRVTPYLHEDLQVEVMKVLLCITYSPNFDINGDSILRIAELCIQTYVSSCHQRSINTAVRATLSQILGDLTLQLRHRQEGSDGDELTALPLQRKDISPTSQALCEDVVTVLTVFCEKLESVDSDNQLLQLLYLECILSMFSSCPPTMHLSRGFTDLVWKQLCPSLVAIMGNPVNDKTITSHHGHMGVLDRERLSDRLSLGISLDVDSVGGGVSDQGRGSGCSSSAPARIAPVVRTVCYIAAELVRLVSCVESMKPVLQSLYHRILLYPPPQHRTEAIRIMKEILGSPQRLYDLAGPCVVEPETRKRSFSKRKSHLDLLKLVMDGMTEACMKGGIEACYSSVSCACALLGALDELSHGRGIQPEQARLLLRRLDDLKEGTESTRESMEINEADFRWQRHILASEQAPWDPNSSSSSNVASAGPTERSPDISISITTETGQTTLDLAAGELGLGPGHTTPEECGEETRLPSPANVQEGGKHEPGHEAEQGGKREEKGGGMKEVKGGGEKEKGGGGGGERGSVVPPDVVQRSHALVYPDITNFLSVESRTRTHHGGGSRYSESNFSMEEQDLSRTEFDSCDQYSMAAEKDSGRSDVSDIGSDNVSLADEEQQTPRDCLGHRSLRTAALSLKLLRNQEADQQSARLFVQSLAALLPRLLGLATANEVDLSLQNFSYTFCSGLQAGGIHSPGFEAGDTLSCQSLMNADGLYLVSYYALLLNLKLCCCDYYRRRTLSPVLSLKEFVHLIQSSGVLVVLSQAWIEELYHQVLERNLLAEAGYWGSPEGHTLPLITMLTDIDGLGSSAIGGQLIRRASSQSPLTCGKASSDTVMAGAVFSRFILTGVWKNLIDVLSMPLTGRMAGSSKGLAFILGAEGIKEQSQRERDTICLSLDGLRKAAALSCALGVAANCASALAQMAAASCVQEEKEEREAAEMGDTITQVKQRVEQRLEQMGRPQGVRLHTAHVLCMDAILNVGLEMGSHNHDCWPHVFRVTEYISSLEHTHFSDGSSQSSSLTTITQQSQQLPAVDLGLELSCEPSPEASEMGLSQPVIQPLSIQELLRECGRGGRGLDLRSGSLMTGTSAAKAVCTLSTQADRLFEEAATKLNLVGLVGFLQQLRKASQCQLFDSITETGDYSLAMPGEAKSTSDRRSALHLFRLGEAMLRIVRNKNRPLLHMMRAWSVVAPHLVEAACHKERHVSQKAVSFIHDVLTEVLTSWAELPHFHFNEALFRPFEHIMQLELCDEDVQDQVITSIGELVEMCSPQILSGWRPLFSALRTVHSSKSDTKDYLLGEYSMGKSQAPVFDVFEAFINTDNIQVFANAATDYIMCLMKFVKGLEFFAPVMGLALNNCNKVCQREIKGLPCSDISALCDVFLLWEKIISQIPFRTIVVSLLSHQVLLQNLYDILLEEFVKQPEAHEKATPVSSDAGRPSAGFLRYISMTNLSIILDLLLDSYRTARDFDTRPGLKYLLMKVSGVCGAANLYRQSAMSFNLYFQALLCATLSQADTMTAQQVKRILYEEEEGSSDSSHPGSASSEDEDIFEETAQVSPPRGREKRHQWRAPNPSLSVQPLGSADWAWLVKRLYKLCMDLCNSYIQMHRDLESTLEETQLLRAGAAGGGDHVFFLPLFPSETSTPTSAGGLSARGTPSEESRSQTADVSTASPGDTPTPSPGYSCTGSLPHHFRTGERRDSVITGGSVGAIPSSSGPGRRKEWWESAGNKLYTIATDKTISKLMMEYKRRKQQQQPQQQSHVNLFMKEQGRAASAGAGGGGGVGGERRGPVEQQRPPQRPQQLVDQQGPPLRHSVSAGPEVLRQEKRPRSGSTISSHSISLRDSEAQIQAWTNMVLTLLNQVLLLSDSSFLALQPVLYPCLSQLSCHVTDARVRQALREWLGRVGRLYDIIV
ncbi:LOW QUALITY PROTEIN: brefeldin A-inhibited guanine nucleotide-exchange protein 3 [Scomber japonicus]|uniref:LOW QUALITY PROTEIN: brefeldin A-inhibited guanine nucleotide-exchange protein 3 n=1 Tax=Scomber japonicus TaxID=13676 RepID=UPI002305631B|nr:LOW QUALITY PROTEIN: brefeldin A-inhibited guanine nucleotide-exchange protein 3 [Scomber japonicus]